MIENDKQREITKRQINEFENKIKRLYDTPCPDNIHIVIYNAQISGMESLVKTLKEDITEYDCK